MKRTMMLLMLLLMLWGCGTQPVWEQVEDVYSGSEPAAGKVEVSLPEGATVLTSAADNRQQIYFCDGFTLTVQTLAGGDLDRSLRETTGFGKDSLTLLETQRDGLRCITCAWTSLGEGGEQVGRLLLLDDGSYHYALTVMADAEIAGELAPVWDSLLSQATLRRTGP